MIKYCIRPIKSPLDEVVKYYAQGITPTPVTLDAICSEIADNCTVTLHDVRGVISAIQERIFKALRNGESVRFGDLGSFHPTLQSKTTVLEKDFTTANILRVRCRFTPSARLKWETSEKNPIVKFQLEKVPAAAPGGGGGSDQQVV